MSKKYAAFVMTVATAIMMLTGCSSDIAAMQQTVSETKQSVEDETRRVKGIAEAAGNVSVDKALSGDFAVWPLKPCAGTQVAIFSAKKGVASITRTQADGGEVLATLPIKHEKSLVAYLIPDKMSASPLLINFNADDGTKSAGAFLVQSCGS